MWALQDSKGVELTYVIADRKEKANNKICIGFK